MAEILEKNQNVDVLTVVCVNCVVCVQTFTGHLMTEAIFALKSSP